MKTKLVRNKKVFVAELSTGMSVLYELRDGKWMFPFIILPTPDGGGITLLPLCRYNINVDSIIPINPSHIIYSYEVDDVHYQLYEQGVQGMLSKRSGVITASSSGSFIPLSKKDN